MDALPVLYSFRRCPYAMRARMAIAVSGAPCHLREVVLKNKPAHMIEISPKATVPVLVTGAGQVIDQSLAIMRWALAQNDPENWLAGDDVGLISENDGAFKSSLDRYKYPSRYDLSDPLPYRESGLVFLERVNKRLSETSYLMGETRSLADMAIFPFLRQFAEVDRGWFDGLPLKPLQVWLEGLTGSALFQSVMEKYAAWNPENPSENPGVIFPAET